MVDEQPAIDFGEAVLSLVEEIPPGRVLTYGAIADRLGKGGPRNVGHVMAREGHGVPWWRVVRANGTLPAHLMLDAQDHWRLEGTPMRLGGVDVPEALWRDVVSTDGASRLLDQPE